MYLRTPERYTNKHRRTRFGFGRLFVWILAPLIIFGSYWVYDNQETVRPMVMEQIDTAMEQGGSMVSTMTAPTPMPTEDPVNLLNRADINWLSGRVEDAISEYEQAIVLVPNDVTTHFNLTLGYIVEGRYETALSYAEMTVTADPFSSDAWAVRALALTRNGDPGSALASGLQAIQLDPNNARAHAFLAEVYMDLEQFSLAEESAELAIELDPNNAEAYYARAELRRYRDFDLEGASADYLTAYDLAPYLTDAAIEKSWVDYNLGNYEASIEILNVVKDANPDNISALYALGFMYNAALGDPTLAADELARCVSVAPDSANCHWYYGYVLIALEQYQDAATNLTRSVELTMQTETPNPRFHYWAGEAQIYLGNCPSALQYLRPGYEIAVEQERDDLISALQTSITECSAFDNSFVPPTEAPAEGEGEDGLTPTPVPDV